MSFPFPIPRLLSDGPPNLLGQDIIEGGLQKSGAPALQEAAVRGLFVCSLKHECLDIVTRAQEGGINLARFGALSD